MANEQTISSPIQNNDQILQLIYDSKIFNDSKTFVDLGIKASPDDIIKSYHEVTEENKQENVKHFVNKYFQQTTEFENWQPEDYNPNPKFLEDVADEEIKSFARDLVAIWPELSRKVKPEIFQNRTGYSIIPLPNGFIIPGGRFKEIYYWDTLWILEGLLICDMVTTARGILDNFIYLINEYGFIPNGNRVYYLSRSQPPVFTMMVEEYLSKTEDLEWLKKNVDSIAKELRYWTRKFITVEKNGKKYSMCRYKSKTSTPRPESFGEDTITARNLQKNEDKQVLYSEIRSAAESGWDFSSRWIFDSVNYELHKIQPSRVIPVDLNAFLCKDFALLSSYYKKLDRQTDAEIWRKQSEDLQIAIEEVLYNTEDGTWYDFDIKLQTQIKKFYASNLTPLWTESFDKSMSSTYGAQAVDYLEKHEVLNYPGGIPCSLVETGQQWDFPNVWAPVQSIVTLGLDKSDDPRAKEVAKELAKKYVKSNMESFRRTGLMFEKYDARKSGEYGGGGEYTIQSGFGWSNGVVLSFIKKFGL